MDHRARLARRRARRGGHARRTRGRRRQRRSERPYRRRFARAAEAAETIVDGHASAYFYDAPEANIEVPLANSATPAFGSGTLGYGSAVNARRREFLGASGFLLVHVDVGARRADNRAPVSARLIPNVGELALEGEQGTLLRRSQVASFGGLARRPRAGGRSSRGINVNEANLYIPIPENCVGSLCAHRIAPEYAIQLIRA